MVIPGGGPRRLASWIESFSEYTSLRASPLIFRTWAGISVIAGVLERKVYTFTRGSYLYPNLYVVLCAPPGVGKSVMLNEVDKIWREIPDIHVSPTSVTEAALIDSLNAAKKSIVNPLTMQHIEYNALQVVSSEFGVLIPTYDPAFMNTLTSLYDGEVYEQRRRSKDLHIKIPKPFINLIGGTTPSSLAHFMPEGAWDQGFASRTIFVYSEEPVVQPLFSDETTHDRYASLISDLRADLKDIAQLQGQAKFTPDAAAAVSAWHESGGEPIPDHPRLQHYITRRTAHLLKLCIVASVQRGPSLTITVDDVDLALQWLIEAETAMPLLFRGMAKGGDSAVMEDVHHWMMERYLKTKAPIKQYELVFYLKQRMPVQHIQAMITTMQNAFMIEPVADGPTPSWKPRAIKGGRS